MNTFHPSSLSRDSTSPRPIPRSNKCLARKRALAQLPKALKTGSSKDRTTYQEAKKYTQSECRKACYRYINDMGAKPSEGEPHSFERFWDFIKSRKCDNSVVPPLDQKFSSVFTNEDTSVPDMGPSPHPDMADINIHKPCKSMQDTEGS